MRTIRETSTTIFWINTLLYRGKMSDEFVETLQKEKEKLLKEDRKNVEGLPTLAQYRHQIERGENLLEAADQIKEKVGENVKWYEKRLKDFEKDNAG